MNKPADPDSAYCAEGAPLDAFSIKISSGPPPSSIRLEVEVVAARSAA